MGSVNTGFYADIKWEIILKQLLMIQIVQHTEQAIINPDNYVQSKLSTRVYFWKQETV